MLVCTHQMHMWNWSWKWLLLLAAIILLNQAHTHTRGKPATFSLASAGTQVFPRALLDKLPTPHGGWTGMCSSPNLPEVTATVTVGHLSVQRWNIWCHQLRESHPQLQPEGYMGNMRVHEHKEIPLPPGERECSDRLHQVIFLFLGFSHFGKKAFSWFIWRKFIAPNWCIFVLLWILLVSWGSQHHPAALGSTWLQGIHGGCQGSCHIAQLPRSATLGVWWGLAPASISAPLAHSHTVEHGREWEE